MAKEVIRPVPARVTVPATIPVYTRVVSLQKQVLGGGGGVIGVSEIVGQRVVVLRVQVTTVWTEYTGLPICVFDLYTGQAKDVGAVNLGSWDLLLPVFVGATTQQWALTPELTSYDWSMRKRYDGDSRRFALSVIIVGTGQAYVFMSVEIAEG